MYQDFTVVTIVAMVYFVNIFLSICEFNQSVCPESWYDSPATSTAHMV